MFALIKPLNRASWTRSVESIARVWVDRVSNKKESCLKIEQREHVQVLEIVTLQQVMKSGMAAVT